MSDSNNTKTKTVNGRNAKLKLSCQHFLVFSFSQWLSLCGSESYSIIGAVCKPLRTDCVHWPEPELFAVTLENWYPASPVLPPLSTLHFGPFASIVAAEFPRTLRENFSSCCNKSYPSWHDHWPALIQRNLTLRNVWICSSGVCASGFFYSPQCISPQCWRCRIHASERKRLNLCEYVGTHLQSDDEYFMGRFQNCFFSFLSSTMGVSGRRAFGINVLCAHFLRAAIYPVYFYSLECLSPLSTVEKDQRYLDKHKNEQITIQGKTHTHTHLSSAMQSRSPAAHFGGKSLEVHCAVLSGWMEHSWQRAVCLSADRSISSGWRTDRWRLCEGNEQREKNAQKRLLCQRRSLQFEMRGSHAVTHTRFPSVHTFQV